MLGTVGIITAMMEIEQIKKKTLSYIKDNETKLKKYIKIAMMAMCAIIAIILIRVLYVSSKNNQDGVVAYNVSDIKFTESDDPIINKFINSYFRARHTLNYPKIFSSFGRDYYKEMREDKSGNTQKIVDNIRYEKTYVRNYENIKVYKEKGYRENDVVCIVTYDLLLGFSDEAVPMIIVFYLEKNGESYIINDKLDVGTSKYLMACMNTKEVTDLYNDIKTRLTRDLISDEALKLAYNSLRQFEMNMNGDLNYDKVNLVENYGLKELDLISDADEIYDYIKEEKNKDAKKERLEKFLSGLKATASNIE